MLFEEIRTRSSRPSRRSQRGAGRLKAIIYTAILVAAVYVAFKLVPVYFAEYQLSDKMQEQARYAVVNRYSDDKIRENLMKVADDLEIPVKKEDIKVFSTMEIVKINVDYTVPVDLLFYHLDIHFTPSSENKALF